MKFGQLFKEITVYGIGDILLKAVGFITLPIYTRLLTPTDYGIWSYVITAIGFMGGILALGGDSAYARFFFAAKTEREKQLTTSTWLGFLTLWSFAVVVLCLPFSGLFSRWSFGGSQYGVLFSLALLATPVQMLNQMCGQVLRNEFRATLFTTLNTITSILSISFSLIAVVLLQLGIAGLVGGALVAALVMLPIRLWSAKAQLRPIFSWQLLRQILAFGVPLVPTSLAYWVFIASDRLVLGKLSTLEQVGLYAVANNLTSTLSFINGAIGQAWSPHAVRIYEGQPEFAPIFYGRVMTYILVGFGILCVTVTAFAYEGLVILSTPPFYPAALAVGPLALGFMALASTQVTALSISLTKKTHYFSIHSWVAALLNLGLNILLVPRWGMVAASWTTALAYFYLTIAYLVTSQKLWPIVYEKRHAIVVAVLTVVFTVAAPFLPQISLLMNIVLKVCYCLSYLLVLILFHVFDHGEWRMVLKTLQGLQFPGVRKTV